MEKRPGWRITRESVQTGKGFFILAALLRGYIDGVSGFAGTLEKGICAEKGIGRMDGSIYKGVVFADDDPLLSGYFSIRHIGRTA